MSSLFNSIYQIIRKFRISAIFLILAIFGVSIFYVTKIKFEEDITLMLPSDENIQRISMVSQNINFMDKLIVNITLSDTNQTPNPQKLIEFADQLNSKISIYQPELIKDINYQVSDKIMNNVYDVFFENLPVFLEDQDYVKMDSLIQQSSVESSIKNNFKTLISPASMVMKKFVMKDPLHFTPIVLKKLNTFQIGDNYEIYNSRIFTKDKKNLSLFVTSAFPSGETQKNGKLIKILNQTIDSLELQFNQEINAQYYGAAAVAVGNANRIKEDIKLTVTIALIVLLVFMSLFFRKKSIFLILFLPAIFGGSMSLAILYLIKGSISAISLGIGSVLLGITVDYSLHLFTHYRSIGDVKKVLKDITIPVMMSTLTTASAFLCLLFVSSKALQDLGMFAAISVVVAALFSLIVLPHFLKKRDYEKVQEDNRKSIIEKITSYPYEKNKYLILGILVFTIVSMFFSGKTSFDGDMDKMSYLSEDLKAAEDNLNKIANVTLKSVYLISTGDNLQEALQNNEKAIPELEKLKQANVINQYTSVSKILISDSLQKERIKKWKDFWTPEKRDQLKLNLQVSGEKYKFKPDAFSSFINLLEKDFKPVNQDDLGELRELFLDEYITEHDDITTVVSILKADESNKPMIYESFANDEDLVVFDKKYMTDNLVRVLKDDFNLLVKLSLGIVFLILLLSFGRIELAIITFIPMAVSWIWTLGIMALFGIQFTIFNIIISTFIFGLGIDYSIFIMQGMLQEYKYGVKNLNSYKTSILLSAITTVTGIGVLILAKHPALKSMALLSIIGILSVIIISYTLEPALFNLFLLNRKKKGKIAYSFQEFMNSTFAWTIFIAGSVYTTLVGFILFRILRIKNKRVKLFFNYSMVWSASTLFYSMFNIRKNLINPNKEKFKKPCVIICNHQSHIDLIYNMSINPKIIILTNDWVQNSKIYGRLVQMADFYPVSHGYEEILPRLQEKVNDGFSILVYPEGTRTTDFKMKRFHKGAFYIAEKLNLDIVPIILHGTGYCMTKGDDLLLKNGTVTAKYLDRITPENKDFGENYSERAKRIGRFFREEYNKLRLELEDPKYYRNQLIKNYIYKGPVLEWYLKVKLKLENNYELFNSLIPRKAKIYDVGCGYGYLSYMLHFVSDEREVIGIDHDSEKILVANNCPSKNEKTSLPTGKIRFESADITQYNFEPADVFLFSDVLHYIPKEEQEKVISNCIKNLNDGGMIIIRDANTKLKERHKGTRFTELFSTKVFGFNKTISESKELYFVSSDDIFEMFKKHNMEVEIVDQTKLTSNVVYIIRKAI
ncbi:MAG TPA: glycerol acyltransferase [Bacteroidales bacterium]|nr:glycerol acyltransferase [Bacteroidales bacterium]